MKIKVLPLLLAVVAIAGCSTASVRVATIDLTEPENAAFSLVRSQAHKCWSTDVNPAKKGIRVAERTTQTGSKAIEAFPVHWATGLDSRPFITIAIEATPNGASLIIDEGPLSCTMFGYCPTLGLNEDVKNWLAGDLTCKDISVQLYRLGIGL